jgi:phytoene dehydrogenase-like protein
MRVVVVGGGINGLVAANYLRRGGLDVVLLEREPRVGGACVSGTTSIDGQKYEFPEGATVLGLMQNFVYQETGLAERLRIWAPDHPKLIYFPGDESASRVKPNEAFVRDEGLVVDYLRRGYREARPPSLEEARSVLGEDLVASFIEGSTAELLSRYFTSERDRTYFAMTVTESSPVSLRSPFSAFTIPLMDSGTIFDGRYGFVDGGIWRITEELHRINAEIGVVTETDARVTSATAHKVTYERGGRQAHVDTDRVVFATDPVTAARLAGSETLTHGLELNGNAGKLTMLFQEPVRWTEGTGDADAEAAFRFLFFHETLDALDQACQTTEEDFTAGYVQVYCDGAAQRRFGNTEPFERIICFFTNLRPGKRAAELSHVAGFVEESVLSRIDNPEALVWTKLLAPSDMKSRFHFPNGNLEHTSLCFGQTFDQRRFSEGGVPFYQLGTLENVFYCGAGAYPCGSVAGTPGYMCAQEILKRL